jgi:hypothetical protein
MPSILKVQPPAAKEPGMNHSKKYNTRARERQAVSAGVVARRPYERKRLAAVRLFAFPYAGRAVGYVNRRRRPPAATLSIRRRIFRRG